MSRRFDHLTARALLAGLRTGPRRGVSPGNVLKLAFVGQSTFFEACSLRDELSDVSTQFIEYRAGANPEKMLAEVRAHNPHVVIVFRPELIPPGLFADVPAATLGFLTEPLPRTGGSHSDLDRRLDDLRALDPGNFDRLVSFDPLIAETAGAIAPIWRSMPIPVADRYYRNPGPLRPDRSALFVGRSTRHREQILTLSKHRHDLLHVAHGVDAAMLERLFDEHDVAINLHNENYISFENRVCLHLAAGHLVLTEPLSPTHGLEPRIDYLEVRSPGHLEFLLAQIKQFPDVFERVRARGRMKAELYRASAVYPRLVHDLYLDLAAFGTTRVVGARGA